MYGLIGSIIGGGIGYAAQQEAQEKQEAENERNRQWSSMEAMKARSENYNYGEMAASAADARQRAQYNDMYSPKAQVEQLIAAGLSPSLMFGGAPSGGTATGQQGGGASGAGAPQAGYSSSVAAGAAAAQSIIGGAQAGSQIELNKALANKANAEAAETRGETPYALANIARTWEEAGNKKAATRLLQFQSDYQAMQNAITEATSESQINAIISNANKAEYEAIRTLEEARSAGYKADFDEQTLNFRVEQEREKLNLLIKQVATEQAQQEYLRNYMETWEKDIAQKYYANQIYEKSVEAQKDWYKEQRNMFTEQLKQDKELAQMGFDITKQGQWINAGAHFITGVSQAAILGMSKTPMIQSLGQKPAPRAGYY